jgi:hypothetical protein
MNRRRITIVQGHPDADHSHFCLDSSVLALSGFRPIHDTFIGSVESLSKKSRDRHLADARSFGEEGR